MAPPVGSFASQVHAYSKMNEHSVFHSRKQNLNPRFKMDFWLKMDLGFLEVFPLHHYEMYTEACCDLINSEWKRSRSARMISLMKSCDNFPTSLVMIYNNTVVGHSKLSLIPTIPDACFVESVVVDKKNRGKGWGKYLMYATEEYAQNCGMQEIYLTALGTSVPEFYKKLGYAPCEPVSIFGGPLESPSESPAPDDSGDSTESPGTSPTTVNGPTDPPQSPIPMPPPLPPPPPPPIYIVYNNKRVLKTFMKKPLYDVEL